MLYLYNVNLQSGHSRRIVAESIAQAASITFQHFREGSIDQITLIELDGVIDAVLTTTPTASPAVDATAVPVLAQSKTESESEASQNARYIQWLAEQLDTLKQVDTPKQPKPTAFDVDSVPQPDGF